MTMTTETTGTRAAPEARIETTIRCRAWTGHPVQRERIAVVRESDGRDYVLVYDDIAGHYVPSLVLSRRTQRRIARRVRAAVRS